jgi:PAS domain S-box-containing protein
VDAATHIAAIAILRDRSDQLLRQSEARYRHSEQRMRAVIENTPNVCVQWYDRRGRVLFANRISRELFGWSELDAIGKTLDQLNFTAPETDRFMEALNDVANTGRVRGPMEFGFVRPDGSPGTLLSTVFRISSPEADHDYCYVCMDVDLTDYKRAQEKLVANERLRAFVYDHVADPIFHLTREGDALFRFSTVNVAFCSATGLEERTVVGKLVHEVIPEPSCSMVLAKYAQAIATRAPVSWEEITPYPSGLKYGEVTVAPTFDAAGICTGLVGTVHDVTARKRAEEERSRLEAEFHHAQRMLALGTFAGGIAHDFNNLLTVMRGQTEIALIEVEARDSRSMRAHLEEIRTASMRATELVRQILTFSRKQEPRRELLAPAAIVDEALRLLRSTLPRSIEVVLNIASDVPRVNADPTQLLQVVMNLGQNAAHATLSQQGTIEIALDALHLQALVGVGGRTLGAGRYVRLRVIDHGCGMDDATLQRVFEPFFTTKGPERGTGLGLSVVLDIVKHHGGAITVDSRVGQGTTFSMYLPAA